MGKLINEIDIPPSGPLLYETVDPALFKGAQ